MKKVVTFYWVLSLLALVGGCNESNPVWVVLLLLVNFGFSSYVAKRFCNA